MQDAQSIVSAFALTRPGKEAMLFKSEDKAITMLKSLNDPAAKIDELKSGTWGFSSDEAIVDLIARITEWHESHVDQLMLIVNNKQADIQLRDRKIPASDPMAVGIRIGVLLSLKELGTLPFTAHIAGMEVDE